MLEGYPFYDLANLSLDTQNCTPYRRTSVKDEILEFQNKFSDATQHFEVCHVSNEHRFATHMLMLRQVLSGITLARGQDALLRGQGGLLRGQDGLLRGQDIILRGQDNLAQMVQKVQSNHGTYVSLTQKLRHRISHHRQSQTLHMNIRRSIPAILVRGRKFWAKSWSGSATFLALLRPSFGCRVTQA